MDGFFFSLFNLVRPVRLERTTNRFEVCDSIQLSYGRNISHSVPAGKCGVSEGT